MSIDSSRIEKKKGDICGEPANIVFSNTRYCSHCHKNYKNKKVESDDSSNQNSSITVSNDSVDKKRKLNDIITNENEKNKKEHTNDNIKNQKQQDERYLISTWFANYGCPASVIKKIVDDLVGLGIFSKPWSYPTIINGAIEIGYVSQMICADILRSPS